MADDTQELIGKWTVWVKGWVWEYEFSPGGKVTWRDTRSYEKGEGRWTMSGTLVNMSWNGSATKESWRRPLNTADHSGWYSSSYYTGNYKVRKLVAPRGATDVDPSVANLPLSLYVDCFIDYKYDVNYKVPQNQSWAFSPILQVKYLDGVVVEFDIEKDFSDQPMSYDETRNQIAHARLGRGGRIVPEVLNQATAPQLWQARAEAMQAQEDEASVIMGLIIAAVAFIVTLPAMAAGARPGSPARLGTRRTIPATKVPPAPILGGEVRLGTGHTPGTLWARIQKTPSGVVYEVTRIFLRGRGQGIPTARATHREMIRQAALAAKAQRQSTFKMVGRQANSDFVQHADQVAKEIGVAGSGKAGNPTIGYPDYEVTLDVAKALASP